MRWLELWREGDPPLGHVLGAVVVFGLGFALGVLVMTR